MFESVSSYSCGGRFLAVCAKKGSVLQGSENGTSWGLGQGMAGPTAAVSASSHHGWVLERSFWSATASLDAKSCCTTPKRLQAVHPPPQTDYPRQSPTPTTRKPLDPPKPPYAPRSQPPNYPPQLLQISPRPSILLPPPPPPPTGRKKEAPSGHRELRCSFARPLGPQQHVS